MGAHHYRTCCFLNPGATAPVFILSPLRVYAGISVDTPSLARKTVVLCTLSIQSESLTSCFWMDSRSMTRGCTHVTRTLLSDIDHDETGPDDKKQRTGVQEGLLGTAHVSSSIQTRINAAYSSEQGGRLEACNDLADAQHSGTFEPRTPQ